MKISLLYRLMSVFQIVLNRFWKFVLCHHDAVTIEGEICIIGRPRVYIKDGSVFLSQNVTLRSTPRFYHGIMSSPVTLTADKPGAVIEVGKNTRLNGCTIHAWKYVKIGADCLVGANTCIMDSNGHSSDDSDWMRRHITQDTPEDIIIEDHVWIGMNCTVLKGIRIGRGSIIAAGSVVVKDVPEFSVVGGNPAKVLRTIKQ